MLNELPTDKLPGFVEEFVRESDQNRREYVRRAELNNAQYLGDFGEAGENRFGHSNFVLNKTQLAILAHTQTQVEQRPRTPMNARESGRTAEYWMSRKALATVRNVIQTGQVASYRETEPANELSIGEDEGLSIGAAVEPVAAPQQDVETQGFVFENLDTSDAQSFEVTEAFIARIAPFMNPWVGADGVPYDPLLKPEDVSEITDAVAADIIQNNSKILWDVGNNDAWLFENIHNNNIIGWQFALYQVDVENQCDVVYNLHPKHVWLAAESTSIEDSDGVVVKEPMSKAAAMRRYPEIAEKIAAYKGDNMNSSEYGVDAVAGPFKNVTFTRTMIAVWHGWFRNFRYPMSPDDAMDAGFVVMKPDGLYLADDDGDPTNERTDPTAANWPSRSGIRQVKVVAGEVVEDVECPYWDIPIVMNKNIPVPFRWVGQGEPQRLEWIDRLVNKCASIIFDTIKYGRSQQEIMPDDLWESLKDQRSKMHSHPGRQMHIPMNVYVKYKDILTNGRGFAIDPPRVSDSVIVFFREMLQLHDVLSGNTAELQGRTSNADMSGRAIESLQSAARGIIGFKATMTEHMLRRLIRLRVHAMCKREWFTLRTWRSWNDKYPKEVLASVRSGRAKKIDLDIEVEVASGGGNVRRAKQAEVRQDYQLGLVDAQTALEKLDYADIDKILERVEQRRMDSMTAQRESEMAAAGGVKGQPTPMAG